MIKSALGLVIRLIDWWVSRKQEADKPENVEIRLKREYDEALAKGDSDTVNRIIHERMQLNDAKKRSGDNSK